MIRLIVICSVFNAIFASCLTSPVSAQTQDELIVLPDNFFDQSGKASFCLEKRKEGNKAPFCDLEPHWQGTREEASLKKVCEAAREYVTQAAPDLVYRIFALEPKTGRWLPRDLIACRTDAEQLLEAASQQAAIPEEPGAQASAAKLDSPASCDPQQELCAVQTALAELKLYTGQVDGIAGPRTNEGIRAYLALRGREPIETIPDWQIRLLDDYAETHRQAKPDMDSSKELKEIALATKDIREIAKYNARYIDRRSLDDFIAAAQKIDDMVERLRVAVLSAMSTPNPSSSPASSAPPSSAKPSALSCLRIDNLNDETLIVVADRALRFRKVRGPRDGELVIGLSRQTAQRLHLHASKLSSDPDRPRVVNINKSVPQVFRKFGDFNLQTELIDPELFHRVLKDSKPDIDVRKVSYQDALAFIKELNVVCADKAKFRLPREEELTHLLLSAYYPANTDGLITEKDLKTCAELRSSREGLRFGFSQLIGESWQLTESRCEKFDPASSPQPSCTGGIVIKGGTQQSTADECLPHYRGEVIDDISNPNTSFRLVLED